MATLAGVFALSHIPRMANAPDAPGAAVRDAVADAFRAAGEAIRATRPDRLIVIAPDHFQNFFIDNMPAILIGCGAAHQGPAEPWIVDPPRSIDGDPALAMHLLTHAYRHGFDPAFSHQMRLDHGTVLPLRAAGFELSGSGATGAGIFSTVPIVPIVVNAVQPPMPRAHRLFAFGRMLAAAIQSYPSTTRITVVVSGGLSHSIAEPGMGRIDEAFDRRFLALLAEGSSDTLADDYEAGVDAAGNGSHEMRQWFVAHGVAGARGFATRFYRPVPEWYLGVAIGDWQV